MAPRECRGGGPWPRWCDRSGGFRRGGVIGRRPRFGGDAPVPEASGRPCTGRLAGVARGPGRLLTPRQGNLDLGPVAETSSPRSSTGIASLGRARSSSCTGALLVHGPMALQRSLAAADEQHHCAAQHVLPRAAARARGSTLMSALDFDGIAPIGAPPRPALIYSFPAIDWKRRASSPPCPCFDTSRLRSLAASSPAPSGPRRSERTWFPPTGS